MAVPQTNLINASICVCEAVLVEKDTELHSAIRIMDTLRIARAATTAHFWVLTSLHCNPGDIRQHVITIKMVGNIGGNWESVVGTGPFTFSYGYKLDPLGPGAFTLRTEFNLDLTVLPTLGLFYVQAIVDEEMVAQIPFRLRRH
jgi:hypothetical protein